MRQPYLTFSILLLSSIAGIAQQKTETISITIQGSGTCTTRPFTVHDNWNIESTSNTPIKIDATSTDGSSPTTLVSSPEAIPPPPSYNATSAPVAKGGTYTLTITSTGTWQVTMIESGFTKSTVVASGAAPAPTPASAPAMVQSTRMPFRPTTYINGIPSPMPGSPESSTPDDHLIVSMNGTGPQASSAPFTTQNGWYIQWNAVGGAKITLIPADGSASTIITDTMAQPTDTSASQTADSVIRASMMQHMMRTGRAPQGTGGTFTVSVDARGPWSVQILQPGAASTTQAGIVTPSASPSSTPATGPAPLVKLTDDQTRAVVLIKGDNGEGTGFLVKMPDGPAVVTNIHVIANNPNIKITTNTGQAIPMLSAKAASDRDVALLYIKDAGYSYLDICPDISKTAQTGDEVVTPGNSLGGEVMLNTGGKVLGIGPQKIEIDNPIYHGNSGGPIFHTKSKQVVGVVTQGMKVRTDNLLDKNSFSSQRSAIASQIRYFGMRLDNVPSWIPLDWDRLQTEAIFLQQFHDQSLHLDAYLNAPEDDHSAEALSYEKDERIMKAIDTYNRNVDTDGRISAGKAMIFDLQGIVDKNMDQIQVPANFYSFDQERAADEAEYRKALKKELESIGDNLDRLKGRH